ncbi:Uncharacterised protein [Mycolicibacterium aurum]|uniref:Uncharacterized protein n=1 Tax=Mycolicibacterium aurum TaxID=1791 RepID=A0A448J0Y6_MYCAU|nr:Uncharacterised protein [Mycolicibacterium aurum]
MERRLLRDVLRLRSHSINTSSSTPIAVAFDVFHEAAGTTHNELITRAMAALAVTPLAIRENLKSDNRIERLTRVMTVSR